MKNQYETVDLVTLISAIIKFISNILSVFPCQKNDLYNICLNSSNYTKQNHKNHVPTSFLKNLGQGTLLPYCLEKRLPKII